MMQIPAIITSIGQYWWAEKPVTNSSARNTSPTPTINNQLQFLKLCLAPLKKPMATISICQVKSHSGVSIPSWWISNSAPTVTTIIPAIIFPAVCSLLEVIFGFVLRLFCVFIVVWIPDLMYGCSGLVDSVIRLVKG